MVYKPSGISMQEDIHEYYIKHLKLIALKVLGGHDTIQDVRVYFRITDEALMLGLKFYKATDVRWQRRNGSHPKDRASIPGFGGVLQYDIWDYDPKLLPGVAAEGLRELATDSLIAYLSK